MIPYGSTLYSLGYIALYHMVVHGYIVFSTHAHTRTHAHTHTHTHLHPPSSRTGAPYTHMCSPTHTHTHMYTHTHMCTTRAQVHMLQIFAHVCTRART